MAPPRHAQVDVKVGSIGAQVDAGIAPLIESLWTLGIRTSFSCEGTCERGPDLPTREEPWGYIQFPDVEDFRRFLDLFATTELSTRRFQTDVSHRRTTTPTWERVVFVKRGGTRDTDTTDDLVSLVGRVGFPTTDLESMTRIAAGMVKLDRGNPAPSPPRRSVRNRSTDHPRSTITPS